MTKNNSTVNTSSAQGEVFHLQYVLPLVMAALITAVTAGWIRIGWDMNAGGSAANHGALMVGSFMSSVIIIERVAAMKNKLLLLIPFVNALSAVFFIINQPKTAQALLIAGSLGLLGICIYFIKAYKEFYYWLFLLSALCLVAGNLILFIQNSYPAAVSCWMLFFLILITAERLELTRFLPLKKSAFTQLYGCLAVAIAGLFIPFHLNGNLVLAAGVILCAAWLLTYDMAFKALRKKGHHQYSAIVLVAGYIWLLFSGFFMLSGTVNALWYDAVLHCFFIGFIFSMIFSHAPIIIPCIIKKPVKIYRPILYFWFGMLHISLASRIVADVFILMELRKWSGMFNGIAILAFFASVVWITRKELKQFKSNPRLTYNP